MTKPKRKAVKKKQKRKCCWQESECDGWQTTCGNAFEIYEGTPEENNMKFCCYCGLEIKDVT